MQVTGATHCAAAIAVGINLAFSNNLGLEESIAVVAVSAIAGLMPDIDHPGSTISDMLGPISKVFNWLERKIMPSGMQHRGVTHTAIIPLILLAAWATYADQSLLLMAFIQGYASHIALDCLTEQGCPILWPLTKFRVKIGLVQTGTNAESVICSLIWMGMCGMLIEHFGWSDDIARVLDQGASLLAYASENK